MKLYWVQVAPNPTKVRLYLAEKNAAGADIALDDQVVRLMKGEQNTPEFLAINPFGALPVLELDDGDTIVESLPIIDYLEELYPAPSMWGDTARARARGRELERIADLRFLVPLAQYIHATNSPLGMPASPDIAERAATLWPRAAAYFDTLLDDGREFIGGTSPGVADCTLQAALQFARFAAADLGIDADYPRLAAWDRNYRERDAVAHVLTH